ncbi:unnamed protein product [Triticum turgidum subsp. durum]|uniref:Morc S5 domain-containing protein n=1 Tax=Triticum turgidum subsp. durum TaxID=4567 RepID=A0A9R1R7U2_TRITD|nr:unnamed protein product [Triticum turgidum subsp. durum]
MSAALDYGSTAQAVLPLPRAVLPLECFKISQGLHLPHWHIALKSTCKSWARLRPLTGGLHQGGHHGGTALAELLDNSLDEVRNGATFVNIDMLENSKDKTRMLLVEDNGGGMDPDKMRQCMSLGYSAKSQVANTIGQYGNGFKTSTMRLGADVLVFSRSRGKEGKRPTQSIGMLSYTFLRSTGKEDIVVPMIDYEKNGLNWTRKLRSTFADWNTSLQTIITWSPYGTEAELLEQFSSIKEQGTRVIIYNLWEDDQGDLELDFDADVNDIQLRGGNRDEKNIEMAKRFPNSKHFLTYRHSLRMVADVTIGFVKDAKFHIDVQGFNVYHRNRLIKPFWRVWTAAGSGGRGVIGVLEANFIEPAHDKQDFERTTLLARLEARLIQMQKDYWSGNAHRIGYVGARSFRSPETGRGEGKGSFDLVEVLIKALFGISPLRRVGGAWFWQLRQRAVTAGHLIKLGPGTAEAGAVSEVVAAQAVAGNIGEEEEVIDWVELVVPVVAGLAIQPGDFTASVEHHVGLPHVMAHVELPHVMTHSVTA